MNRIVDGRFDKPKAKQPCDHYSIRRDGQIVCQKCEAVWNLGIAGPVWVEKDA